MVVRKPTKESDIDFFQLMEDRRLETESHIEKLHIRINDLRDDLHKEIEKSHNEIMSEIKQLRSDQKTHNDHENEVLQKLDSRLHKVENWRWLIMGGGLVVGWLLLGGLEALKNIF
jgi:seryl-tRNA synthetase